MSDDSTTQCLLFPGIFRKPVVAQFDQREGSSDGGALLLKAADRHYGLVAGLAWCLRDERQASKVDHSLRELVGQRVFSIACGYPDANDSARLSGDPIHKLLLDRDPLEGRDLASQPTLSRFENGVGVKELYRSGEFLAESVIRRHAKRLHRRAYRVTIDLDPTDDPTHGAQQLSFFNGHYDAWCYLPVMGFVSFNDILGSLIEKFLASEVNLSPRPVFNAKGEIRLPGLDNLRDGHEVHGTCDDSGSVVLVNVHRTIRGRRTLPDGPPSVRNLRCSRDSREISASRPPHSAAIGL